MPCRFQKLSAARLMALVMGLGLALPVYAQDLSRALAVLPPDAAPVTDRALTDVRGRGVSDVPKAHQQLAVILWDERGGAPKASDAAYSQSLGPGNSQSNILTQN